MTETYVDGDITFEYKPNRFVKQGCGTGLKATRGYHCDFKYNNVDYIYDFDTLTNKAKISKKGDKALFGISEREENELENKLENITYEKLQKKVEEKIKNRIHDKAHQNKMTEYNKAESKGMSGILKFGFELQQKSKQIIK